MAEEKYESWDAFWAEVTADRPTETIRGVTVTIPADLPLFFQIRLQKAWESEGEEDFKALVADLFGADALDAWIAAGMEMKEFQTVLVWGVARGSGRDMTFAEAYEVVSAGGKAPAANRSERRRSAGTGGPSRRTSNASTTSGRKTSQA